MIFALINTWRMPLSHLKCSVGMDRKKFPRCESVEVTKLVEKIFVGRVRPWQCRIMIEYVC